MKLIEEKKFLKDIFKDKEYPTSKGRGVMISEENFKEILSKHLKDIVDEPYHPSGLDHDRIKIRNELREELRTE